METYQIVWTNRAVKDLRKVYSFYSEQAGEEKAFKIIKNLLAKADVLSDARFVQMGATDLALSHLKRDYKK